MKRSIPFAVLALTGALLSACAPHPTPDATKPTVALTAAPTTVTAAGTITLSATATDNVGVTKVDFYQGSTLISSDTTSPYTATASVTSAQNGSVTYRAVASDAAGNTAEATASVTVNIDVTAPTVSVTATPSTLTSPGTVTFTANASDNVGVTKVEFYDNGTLIATDTTAPYAASKAYTGADNGTHTITAKAFDAQGQATSSTTTLTVNIDTVAPTVTVAAAPTRIEAAGTATFTATASDNVGVTKVEFYDNGTLIATDTDAPYTASKAYAFADNGTHTITAKAFDAQGNTQQATTPFTVAIADANEPNDSVAAATALPIGTTAKGFITGQARDMDYFKFDATAGDMLKLTVKSVSADAASTLDPYVMILMPDGKTILEKDDDSGAGLESEIRFNVPATGTYTVVVTSFNIHDDPTATDDKVTNTYQIALSRR
ncbi:hypothetical protein GCM10008956_25600 [Deinococcus arenae]|uniref:PKD/Chitinase domain-containing protein n=1 Tax=Deinococcus arenae TaxID=1452751 RepID=A0A8H9GR61_9DEIO|nr:Ig-like domain-containing protein [Deinococcus arenae]AWT34378.1 peptidase-like protein [Deinococcus actinosclerus]GGM48306.1 hypothetical protein GCM10008956_25600 [Deinococcus arenae]